MMLLSTRLRVWNPDMVVPPSELRRHGRRLMAQSLSASHGSLHRSYSPIAIILACRVCRTRIRLQLAIYFCLHRGSLPENTARRQPRFRGQKPIPDKISEKYICQINRAVFSAGLHKLFYADHPSSCILQLCLSVTLTKKPRSRWKKRPNPSRSKARIF
jgi:hypothetical protein